MRNFILKRSQLFGLRTFGWEMKLRLLAIIYPILKPIAFVIGGMNNLQMEFDKFLRFKLFKDNTEG